MAFGIHLGYYLVLTCFFATLALAMPQDPRGQLWDNVDVGAQQEEPSERQARHLWGGGLWGTYYGNPYSSYRSYHNYGYPNWGYNYRRYYW